MKKQMNKQTEILSCSFLSLSIKKHRRTILVTFCSNIIYARVGPIWLLFGGLFAGLDNKTFILGKKILG